MMRRIILALFLLAFIPSAQGGNVFFPFKNVVTGSPYQAELRLQPTNAPAINNGSLVIANSYSARTDTNGQCTVSNLVPLDYDGFLTTKDGYTTRFRIHWTNALSDTSIVNFTTLIIVPTNVIPGISAYSISAADARFLTKTNPTFTGTITGTITGNGSGLTNIAPSAIPTTAYFTNTPALGFPIYALSLTAGQSYYFAAPTNGNEFITDAVFNVGFTASGFFTAPTNNPLYVISSDPLVANVGSNVTSQVFPALSIGGHFTGVFNGDASGAVGLNGAHLTNLPTSLLPVSLQNPRPLSASAVALRMIAASNTPTRFLILGDSIASGQAGFDSAPIAMIRLLKQQFGNAGTALKNLDTSFNAAYFSRPEINIGLQFPGAAAVYASDGASGVRSLQSAGNAAGVPVNQVGVYWWGWPKGGTISVNITNSFTNVTFTVNGLLPGATNIFRTNWAVAAATNNAVFITSTTATNIPIGIEYAATNLAGIEDCVWALGGTDINDLFTVGTNAFASFGAAYAPHVILHESLHFPPNTFTLLNREVNYARGGSTNNVVVIIATHPPNFDLTAVELPILRQVCDTNGAAFYYCDLYGQFPSFTANTAAGLMLDGLHPNGVGAIAFGAELVRLLGFNTPANINGMVTNGATGLTLGGTFSGNGAGLTNNSGVAYGVGTVTSVGLSLPGVIFNASVTGSPVTSSGTLTPTLLVQTTNAFLAGPNGGSAATPTFRAIVANDLTGAGQAPTNAPTIFNAINSGTFTAKVNGTNELAIAQGGVTIAGLLTTKYFALAGSLPTASTNGGTAIGGSGSITVDANSNGSRGSATIVTSPSGNLASVKAGTITFETKPSADFMAIPIPLNAVTAGNLGSPHFFFTNYTTSTMEIWSCGTAPGASTTYKLGWLCIQ